MEKVLSSEAISMVTTRRTLSSVYHLNAIKRISGFRTLSDEAILELRKIIPIDILADVFAVSCTRSK